MPSPLLVYELVEGDRKVLSDDIPHRSHHRPKSILQSGRWPQPTQQLRKQFERFCGHALWQTSWRSAAGWQQLKPGGQQDTGPIAAVGCTEHDVVSKRQQASEQVEDRIKPLGVWPAKPLKHLPGGVGGGGWRWGGRGEVGGDGEVGVWLVRCVPPPPPPPPTHTPREVPPPPREQVAQRASESGSCESRGALAEGQTARGALLDRRQSREAARGRNREVRPRGAAAAPGGTDG